MHEIVSNPVAGKEWVECVCDEDCDVSRFTLSDEKGVIFTFPEGSIFSAGEFFIAEGWNNKLNNTGDSVFVRDATGRTVFSVEHFPKMKKGESWAWNGNEFQKTEIVTKAAENRFSSEPEDTSGGEKNTTGKGFPPPHNGEIKITEVMSHPDNGEEWIEIFSSASETRNLGGFTLSDDVGVIYTFPTDFGITPQTYLRISGWKTKLNNSGDSVFLTNAAGDLFDAVRDFPALDTDISWAKKEDGNFAKTGTPTPAEKNIFSSASTPSSKSTKKSLVKTLAHMPSLSADDVDIVLSEIMFRGKDEDFVELFCKKCDKDLGGFRLVDDDAFFEFPPKTVVKSGDFILVHLSKLPPPSGAKKCDVKFQNEDGKCTGSLPRAQKKEKNIWHFWSTKTGLTATDETIFLIDSRGNIEHAVCIANHNGTFSPGEKEDITRLIDMRALRAYHPLSENACFDSRLLGTNISLVFSGRKTGHSDVDFFWSAMSTPGKNNGRIPQRAENIKLQMNVWENEKIRFGEIQNTGKKLLRTADLHLFDMQNNEYSLPQKILPPGERLLFSLPKNTENTFSLTDTWGEKITQTQTKKIDFTHEKTELLFSEFFANPVGSDDGKEFVEITCLQEQCRTSDFFFFLDGKEIIFPEKTLKKNEKEVIFLPVKNTEFTAEIYHLSRKKLFSLQVPNAREGESFSYFSHGKFLWGVPTPMQKNIPIVTQKNKDSDGDGIPDAAEITIDSDPFFPEDEHSPAQNLFSGMVKHTTSLSVRETKKEIVFSGKSLPSTSIIIIVDDKKMVRREMTDENGLFSFSGNPNLPAGKHTVHLLIFPTAHHPLLYKRFSEITITQNPKDKILSHLSLALVLPNPKGNDANREIIVVQNTGKHAGFAKNIVVHSGDKEKILPEFFLHPGQKKVLRKKHIPTLLNTNGSVFLADANGKVLDSVSWKKARSGEWFGKHAPSYKAPQEKKRSIKTRNKKHRPPLPMPTDHPPALATHAGEMLFVLRHRIAIRTPEGVEVYHLGKHFSQETIAALAPKGTPVTVETEGTQVTGISIPPPVLVEEQKSANNPQPFLLFLLVLAIFFNAGVSAYRKEVFISRITNVTTQ